MFNENFINDVSLYGYNSPLDIFNISTFGFFRDGGGIDIGIEIITDHAERSINLLIEQFRREYSGNLQVLI